MTNELFPVTGTLITPRLDDDAFRDQCAIAAMQGLVAGNGWAQLDINWVVGESYHIADAMLIARKK